MPTPRPIVAPLPRNALHCPTPDGPVPPRYSTGTHFGGRRIPRVWVRPFVDWGTPYGGHHQTKAGEPMWMQRKGQRVRWFNGAGKQVGPEQANVAPAIFWASAQGWL